MISDARTLPDGTVIQADFCIVGAGAAGISLALGLSRSGYRIVLLEAGGEKEEAEAQALYEGRVVNPVLHSPADSYRQRRFGGTTTIWGGRCVPFDPLDFEARPYVPHSGWPIGYEEIARYYPQANRLCEAGVFDYHSETAFTRPLKPMIPGFDQRHFTTDTLERFSCPTDFHVRYHEKLSAPNIQILLHANLTRIALSADGNRVTEVEARTLSGNSLSVKATCFVLCAGGLETVRLLLANRDVHGQGIGNLHDVVGRYYMCHIAGTMGGLRFSIPPESIWNGYDISDEGIYCRRRLALRPEVQRHEHVGSFVARLHHPRITDPSHGNGILSALYCAKPFISYEYAKRLFEDEPLSWQDWYRHLKNVALGVPDIMGFAWHMLRDRKLAARKFPSVIIKSRAGLYSLDFHAEQMPDPMSRVGLTHEKDRLGMQKIEIDWRYLSQDVHTVKRSLALLKQDIAESGVGSFDYDPQSVEKEMTRYGAYGGHHIGTVRMGTSPRTSVTNSDCRVHGVANLYLAGSGVFPTSSQANPTLTIVALSLRLADHLQSLDFSGT